MKYSHGQFCWVDLNARDTDVARAFYTRLFGWQVDKADTGSDGPHYELFGHAGEVVAGMGRMDEEMRASGTPSVWVNYISVDDIDKVVERAAALGADVVVPPMDVTTAGRMAFINDPAGAVVAFWQPGDHPGAERVNQPGSFCWNELATRDADAAKKFFGELLDWTFEENPHAPSIYHIAKNAGRSNGGIMQMTEEWGDLPSHWMVYFAVEDAARAADMIAELGGQVHHGPFETAAGKLAVCQDPQGAMFHIIELSAGIGE